jgi:hypothetical protein
VRFFCVASKVSVVMKRAKLQKETPQQEGPTCGSVRGWPRSTNFNKLGRRGGMPENNSA